MADMLPFSRPARAAQLACLGLGLALAVLRGERLRSAGKNPLLAIAGIILFFPKFAWPLSLPIFLALRSSDCRYKIATAALLPLCLLNAYPALPFQAELAVAVFFLGLFFAAAPGETIPPRFGRALAPLLFVAALSPFARAALSRLEARSLSPAPSALGADWKDLQLWARERTSVGAVFVTPPYRQGFRFYSQRSPFVEWTDGAAMHWSPGFEKEWTERLARLGYSGFEDISALRLKVFPPEQPPSVRTADIYERVDAGLLAALAKDYGIAYVVREGGPPLPLPLVYRNGTFRVYAVNR